MQNKYDSDVDAEGSCSAIEEMSFVLSECDDIDCFHDEEEG